MDYTCKIGDFVKFGAQVSEKKITFTFDGGGAKKVSLLLFENKRPWKKKASIQMQDDYRTGNVYSVTVTFPSPDTLCYLYQLDDTLVLDPYASIIYGREQWNDEARYQENYQVYGGFITQSYSWKVKKRKAVPESEMVLYKLHMRGFTMNHGLAKGKQGNAQGFLTKLDELERLGITAVEFQPLYEFEEMVFHHAQVVGENKKLTTQVEEAGAVNYWGYGMAQYMAPKASFFPGTSPDYEMKKMIDQLHEHHMECVMEISFSNPCSTAYMIQVLHHWVLEYHVDGFHLLGVHYPIEEIAADPYLAHTKIFGEKMPMEVLEHCANKHLFLYNDDFMYEMRKNLNHMDGSLGQLMDQCRRQNEKYGFVNYCANSTGFTLLDSFSYGEKHNEENGEDNMDGNNYNCSYNYGVEGITRNKEILNMRYQQMRNAYTILLLSQGIPMIHAGDERANSQEGNNNPYCQDNPVGWTQFSKGTRQTQLCDFVRSMISFRREHMLLHPAFPFKMTDYLHKGFPDLSYHGKEPWMLSLGDEKRMVGVLYAGAYTQEEDIYVAYNFYYESTQASLPKTDKKKIWYQIMNTATEQGMMMEPKTPLVHQNTLDIPGQSISILISGKIK